jgi:hypothetical protein
MHKYNAKESGSSNKHTNRSNLIYLMEFEHRLLLEFQHLMVK